MMLELHAHQAFDKSTGKWCLKKTEVRFPSIVIISLTMHPDRQCVHSESLQNLSKGHLYKNNHVTFRDYSDHFNSGSSRNRKRPIPLPNPDYIAIQVHGTIAEVLNMSDVGKIFDELLDKYKDEGNVPLVQSWPELEKEMKEEVLRESVAVNLLSHCGQCLINIGPSRTRSD